MRRRHELLGIAAEDALDDLAVVRLAGNDRLRLDGFVADIQSQLGFAMIFVRPVASKAAVRKNRPDVTVELDAIFVGLDRVEVAARREGNDGQGGKDGIPGQHEMHGRLPDIKYEIGDTRFQDSIPHA